MSSVLTPPIERGYVRIPDGQVHFRERHGTAPAIVFLHQTALSSRCYEPLLRELALPNRLVAPDMPGFGASFAPQGWPTLEHYGTWLFAALEALGVGQMHLFGHHTGASLAVEMARQHPERVLSLMLCGPVCFTSAEKLAFRADFEKALAPDAQGLHLLENWRYCADHNAGLAPEVIHDQVIDMLIAWRARPQAYVAVAGHDFDSAFLAVHAPVLILSSPGDYFEDHVSRCLALRPGTPVTTIRGGNLATELDPAGAAEAIAGFLARPT